MLMRECVWFRLGQSLLISYLMIRVATPRVSLYTTFSGKFG